MPLAVLLVRAERGSCRPVSRAQRGEKCCAAAVQHRDHVGWLGAHLPVPDRVQVVVGGRCSTRMAAFPRMVVQACCTGG